MTWLNRHWRYINLTGSVFVLTLALWDSKSDAVLPCLGWLFTSIELMRPRL